MTIEEWKNLTDQEMLDQKIGGLVIRDMTAITFIGVVTEKINGAPAYSADTQEILAAVRGAPMSRVMAEEEKVRLLRKLLALNINI